MENIIFKVSITVCQTKYCVTENNLHKLILYIHHTYFCIGHGINNLLNICKKIYVYNIQVIFQIKN
jgi:hypothetical protein